VQPQKAQKIQELLDAEAGALHLLSVILQWDQGGNAKRRCFVPRRPKKTNTPLEESGVSERFMRIKLISRQF
jgi:hypothetical protein